MMYIKNHAEMLKKFSGLWKDQYRNIVYIQYTSLYHFTASFALGSKQSPFIRRCYQNALTIDMPCEFRPTLGTFAIQFGKAYRGPELHVAYCYNTYTQIGYLEPSYVVIESATDVEQECYDLIRGVDDLYPVVKTEWDDYLTRYHLTNNEITHDL